MTIMYLSCCFLSYNTEVCLIAVLPSLYIRLPVTPVVRIRKYILFPRTS